MVVQQKNTHQPFCTCRYLKDVAGRLSVIQQHASAFIKYQTQVKCSQHLYFKTSKERLKQRKDMEHQPSDKGGQHSYNCSLRVSTVFICYYCSCVP